MITVCQTLQQATSRLSAAGVENARGESRWIVEDAVGASREQLLLNPDQPITFSQEVKIDRQVARRCSGEPLQYILGKVNFYGYDLRVGPGVLIPRPETELLADLAIRCMPKEGCICDMCTGSGALAIVLAAQCPKTAPQIVAVDISANALAYAAANCRRHHTVVNLLQADLFSAFTPSVKFQLIVANPPYIAPREYRDLPVEVRNYEPREALVADLGGTGCFQRLANGARHHLAEGGRLLCEIGEEQSEKCRQIAYQAGFSRVIIHQDFNQRNRFVEAVLISENGNC